MKGRGSERERERRYPHTQALWGSPKSLGMRLKREGGERERERGGGGGGGLTRPAYTIQLQHKALLGLP